MAIDLVEDAGFVALAAASGDQAVGILEARDDIRLVFTDIDMPGSIDGVKLAACVRRRWPPIEIIVTSGHVVDHQVALPSGSVFVAKPYDPRHIGALMQRMTT